MKKYKIDIKEKGIFINETLINEKIFSEEEVNYRVVEREQQINDLCMWISEATGSDRANDLYLMKEDLKYLINLKDEFVFSSTSTNEFIAKKDNLEGFNLICKEILELNK